MSHVDEDADDLRSVELGTISRLFDGTDFPVTTADVIEEFGTTEIQYPHGSDPIATVLETSGHETYESRDELELAILNGVRRDAVGRPRYSDRSDEVAQELDRPHQSF